MKAVNKKNIDEFMEFVNKVMKEDGFILQAKIENWLKDNMFRGYKNKNDIVKHILDELASHKKSKVHDKHYDSTKCKNLGLKIYDIEKDQELQDLILTIHHTYILSIYRIPLLIKLIENQNGQSFILTGQR